MYKIDELLALYDQQVEIAQLVMQAKNHDYGASWESDRPTTITDTIRHKIDRIIVLEELRSNGKDAKVAEGISAELRDIMNYCVFRLIKERENGYS